MLVIFLPPRATIASRAYYPISLLPPRRRMLTLVIWWINALMEAALLCRALPGRFLSQFPVFFGYILFVLSTSILRKCVMRWMSVYSVVYWSTEFLALILGSYVVFEVYRLALRTYPGTAKMARNVLLFLFALALARAINVFLSDPYILQYATGIQIERALRTFQAIAILSLITLLLSYSIPLGRNLHGILKGYSLFVGARVLCLEFVGETGKGFWFYAYSASYIAALGIWLVYLWSPVPIPEQPSSARLVRDYNLIAAKTHQRLLQARLYLRRVAGS